MNKESEVHPMVAKLPVLSGKCDTVTMMSYGIDPYLASWSHEQRVGGTSISLNVPDILSLPPIEARPNTTVLYMQ